MILYLLSDTFSEIFLVGIALLTGLPAPILAGQILWVNLIEHGLMGVSLAFEPQKDIKNQPNAKDAPLIDNQLKISITIIAGVTNFGLLGLFYYLLQTGMDIALIRTVIFIGLGMDSLFYVFSCKSLSKNIWQTDIFDNKFLNISVFISIIVLFASIQLPVLSRLLKTTSLPLWAFAVLIIFALTKVAIIEAIKFSFKPAINRL